MKTTGFVQRAFGNLLHVKFDGSVIQGEIAYVELDADTNLKAEVIEVKGDEAKIQVFEDTTDIKLGTPVHFTCDLLEAELGPGLLTSIFDGLQNPLEKIATQSGNFLPRGSYLPPLDRSKKWKFQPKAKAGKQVHRSHTLGVVQEERFDHLIMVPFSMMGSYTVVSVADAGEYTLDEPIAVLQDENGENHDITMVQKWPVKNALSSGEKIKPFEMMDTGLRIVDTQFPILKGSTFCSPGPFGAGKTVLQHHFSKYAAVDIVIVCACGERAGEVVEVLKTFPELTDPHTNSPLIDRTVIICNTSSMPVAAREASIYMGATISEYYRQMGLNVLLLADSTSRWAQAMREMSGRLEEIPGEEAFPAYLASRIAAFYERAGAYQLENGKIGTLTIGGTVSPAGGNFEEPVTQATLSAVGAFLGLSRARSDARRYPAIDPLISWSKYHKEVGLYLEKQMSNWSSFVQMASQILGASDEIEKRMEVVGEEGIALEDMLTFLKGQLYEICYLQQNAFDKQDAYFPIDRQIESVQLIDQIFGLRQLFQSRDQMRDFFLTLQNDVKNLNYLKHGSADYKKKREQIIHQLEELALVVEEKR